MAQLAEHTWDLTTNPVHRHPNTVCCFNFFKGERSWGAWKQCGISCLLLVLSSCCRRSTRLRDVWKTHIAAWYYCSSTRHGPQKEPGFGFIKMLLTFQLMKGQIISSEKSALEGKGRERKREKEKGWEGKGSGGASIPIWGWEPVRSLPLTEFCCESKRPQSGHFLSRGSCIRPNSLELWLRAGI